MVHGPTTPTCPWPTPGPWPTRPRGPSDLHEVLGAGHWLRADPRVIAILVGWLERRH